MATKVHPRRPAPLWRQHANTELLTGLVSLSTDHDHDFVNSLQKNQQALDSFLRITCKVLESGNEQAAVALAAIGFVAAATATATVTQEEEQQPQQENKVEEEEISAETWNEGACAGGSVPETAEAEQQSTVDLESIKDVLEAEEPAMEEAHVAEVLTDAATVK